jgi:predicted transcriptional regulator
MREIALKVGITERAVQNIVKDLIQGGALSIEKMGRKNSYRVNGDIALRHPIESHRTLSDLLDFISMHEGVPDGSSE